MAFIDWLRKQQEESARNTRLFQGRPRVAASQAWEGYRDPNPQSRLMVRQPSPTSVTLTEKDDGSTQKVTKWEPDKQEKRLKATALPSGPAMGAPTPLRAKPSFGGLPLDISRWGGQRGQIENQVSPGMMARDPTWAGVPRARAAPDPRRVQAQLPQRGFATRGMGGFTGGAQRYDMARDPGWAGVPRARPQPSIANIGVPPHIPRMRGDIGAADSIGMPRVADLRNRVREIGRQQATIPRQQMPPPRFVPPVDPRQFPTVQDRGLGTYDIGEPGVQMGGGFDWSGQALRENVGEDWDNIGKSYTNWWKNLVEETKRKRQRGNY